MFWLFLFLKLCLILDPVLPIAFWLFLDETGMVSKSSVVSHTLPKILQFSLTNMEEKNYLLSKAYTCLTVDSSKILAKAQFSLHQYSGVYRLFKIWKFVLLNDSGGFDAKYNFLNIETGFVLDEMDTLVGILALRGTWMMIMVVFVKVAVRMDDYDL